MKHFIIVKFKETVNKEEIIEPIKKLFNKALELEGVDKINIHLSNSDLQNRHDLMIEMNLTPTGLIIFDNSEIHKKWKSEYGELIITKTIFDCD